MLAELRNPAAIEAGHQIDEHREAYGVEPICM